MELPNDPMILFSFVNTKLRDNYPSLDDLCEDLHLNKETLLKKLAAAISRGRPIQMKVSMPLTKGLFRKAANRYWLNRGQAFGVTQAQMSSLEIEGR